MVSLFNHTHAQHKIICACACVCWGDLSLSNFCTIAQRELSSTATTPCKNVPQFFEVPMAPFYRSIAGVQLFGDSFGSVYCFRRSGSYPKIEHIAFAIVRRYNGKNVVFVLDKNDDAKNALNKVVTLFSAAIGKAPDAKVFVENTDPIDNFAIAESNAEITISAKTK